MVDALRTRFPVAVTLSVGEQPTASYALWKEAGASRFLLKHETADASLYAALHPGYTLTQRVDALQRLRRAGYEIGSGFIVGVPGQRPETLADDILLARELHRPGHVRGRAVHPSGRYAFGQRTAGIG